VCGLPRDAQIVIALSDGGVEVPGLGSQYPTELSHEEVRSRQELRCLDIQISFGLHNDDQETEAEIGDASWLSARHRHRANIINTATDAKPNPQQLTVSHSLATVLN